MGQASFFVHRVPYAAVRVYPAHQSGLVGMILAESMGIYVTNIKVPTFTIGTMRAAYFTGNASPLLVLTFP